MKNTLKYLSIVLMAFLLKSCKKKETSPAPDPLVTGSMVNGLPADRKKLSGYFYAENDYNPQYSSSRMYSAFSEPSANLLAGYNHYQNTMSFSDNVSGNIKLGQVIYNSFPLTADPLEPHFIYFCNAVYLSAAYLTAGTAEWTTEGNKSFRPLDINVERGFPKLNLDTARVGLISRSGFTIDIASQISNFDSVYVEIYNYYGYNMITKRSASSQPIVFTASDFAQSIAAGISTGNMRVLAFNYSNKLIDSRMYVFELSTKRNWPISFVP